MNPIMPHSLADLLAGAGSTVVNGDSGVSISSISVDSRRVEPGALFVCLRGTRDDGHAHAAEAVAAGAAAVLAERTLDSDGAPLAIVSDTLAALSGIAARMYTRPSRSLTIVGVTGTNGKTTTTHFIEAIAAKAGTPFGLVGTLGARLAGRFEIESAHTTPFSHDLQRILARFRDAGAKGAVLEVSSHALMLHRVDDIDFDVATFTNLTSDHLDFHASAGEYRAAKRRLFELAARKTAKGTGVGVFNADDAASIEFAGAIGRSVTYSLDAARADFRATNVSFGPEQTTFEVKSLRPAPFSIRLPGAFNVANAMAALATAAVLDFDVEAIAEGLDSVREVPGRMMRVAADGITVFVDYAHTPDGLTRALEAARSACAGRLICVFGCGGDRDPYKRPVMGAIARRMSDVAIVTSDNPRFEDPARIIADVLAGVTDERGGDYESIPDREAAIERGIALAKPGDVVVIAGKGHEAYQLVRGERLPFSDVDAATAALRKRAVC